jgi:PAS domain-containing protein
MEGSGPIQAARYGMLSEVVLFIAKTAEVERLLGQLAGKLKWLLDFDRCTLALVNADDQDYRLQTLLETRPTVAPVTEAVKPLAYGLAGAVMQSGQPRLVNDLASIQTTSLEDPALRDGSLNTVLSLPLEAFGKVLGALTFASAKPNAYSRKDIKVATSLATHLALALDRWQQIERLQQVDEELVRLASFPRLNPSPIIEIGLDGIVHYLNPAAEKVVPECREQGFSSPLLADLPELVKEPLNSKDYYVREVASGETWYRQLFHRIAHTDRIRAYHIDITERKQAEEKLKRQNELLAALQETAGRHAARLFDLTHTWRREARAEGGHWRFRRLGQTALRQR